MSFLGKVFFLLKFFKDLQVYRLPDDRLSIIHPKGLKIEYSPIGTCDNVLPEIYVQYKGALLQSSVILSLDHDGTRPWQEPQAEVLVEEDYETHTAPKEETTDLISARALS